MDDSVDVREGRTGIIYTRFPTLNMAVSIVRETSHRDQAGKAIAVRSLERNSDRKSIEPNAQSTHVSHDQTSIATSHCADTQTQGH